MLKYDVLWVTVGFTMMFGSRRVVLCGARDHEDVLKALCEATLGPRSTSTLRVLCGRLCLFIQKDV